MGELSNYQARVGEWAVDCFGYEIATDFTERNRRFLEEALELVQAAGYSAAEAHAMVDYVYGRPPGEIPQEIGGVMVTLASFCAAHGLGIEMLGENELTRCLGKTEEIRKKQALKPEYLASHGFTELRNNG